MYLLAEVRNSQCSRNLRKKTSSACSKNLINKFAEQKQNALQIH